MGFSEFLPIIFKVSALLLLVLLPVGGFVVYTQEWQIFPAAFETRGWIKGSRADAVPSGIEGQFLTTPDGTRIELWRREADALRRRQQPPTVALYFNGNGEIVDHSPGVLNWFAANGMNGYAFGYRGFGHSSGQPTEQGIYEDCDTVLDYIVKREGIDARDLLLVGRSLGTGPASYIAAKTRARRLVLVSPYVSIDEVVRDSALLAPLVPFLRVHFPTLEYLKKLDDTEIVLLHGAQDATISVEHSRRISETFTGRKNLHFIEIPGAGHNDIFFEHLTDIGRALGLTATPVVAGNPGDSSRAEP